MPGKNNYKGFPRPTVDCTDDFKKGNMAVQSDANEVDINKIVARMQKGGTIPIVDGEPFYGDVSGLNGLQDAFIKVREANELFMEYPADIRERFENDPVKMVDFFSDDNNYTEAVDLGLVKPRPGWVRPDSKNGDGGQTPSPVPEPGK